MDEWGPSDESDVSKESDLLEGRDCRDESEWPWMLDVSDKQDGLCQMIQFGKSGWIQYSKNSFNQKYIARHYNRGEVLSTDW